MSLSRNCLLKFIKTHNHCTRPICNRLFSSVTYNDGQSHTLNQVNVNNTSNRYGVLGITRQSHVSHMGYAWESHGLPNENHMSKRCFSRSAGKVLTLEEVLELDATRRSALGDADVYFSIDKWNEVQKEYVEVMTKTQQNFQTIAMKDVIHLKYYEMCQSLFDWSMSENVPVADIDVILYIKLCVENNQLDHIFRWFAKWQENKHKVTYAMCALLIDAFCRTDNWKESLPLLEQMEAIETPRRLMYGHIISAASRCDDRIVIQDLLNRMSEKGVSVAEITLGHLMASSMRQGKLTNAGKKLHEICDKLLAELLDTHHKNSTYPSLDLVNQLQAWLKR